MSTTPSQQWRLGYRPGLDGLRGIAVALVLINHTGLPFTGTAGTVGVNVFFVLSGFLITRLLIEEKETYGRVSLKHFYQRRALRIFPAMYVYLAVTTVAAVIFREPLKQLAYAGLYVVNIVRAGGGEIRLVPHTWSLAMEEQFYLVWPLLAVALLAVAAASRRRAITAFIVAGMVLSFGARIALGLTDASLLRLHNGPDIAAGVLLLGCLLAVLADRISNPRFGSPMILLVGLTAIVATSLGEKSVSFYLIWLPVAIVGAAMTTVYLIQDEQAAWVRRTMTSRPLLYLGRISYGLYLWHYTVYFVVKNNVTSYPYKPVLQISLSLVVAAVSYHFLELRFLEIKDRMRQIEPARTIQARPHPLRSNSLDLVGAGSTTGGGTSMIPGLSDYAVEPDLP